MNKFALTIAIVAGTTVAAAVAHSAEPGITVDTSFGFAWMMLAGAALWAFAPKPVRKAIRR